MSEEPSVTYALEGEVALIGPNCSERRNAPSSDLMRQLLAAVVRAGEAAQVPRQGHAARARARMARDR